MNTKKEYISPELTAVSFKCENGYAASNLGAFQIVNTLVSALNGGVGGIEGFNGIEENTALDDNTFTWE